MTGEASSSKVGIVALVKWMGTSANTGEVAAIAIEPWTSSESDEQEYQKRKRDLSD